MNRNGTLNEGQLNDGSIIVPEHRVENHLKRLLERKGVSNAHIEEALETYQNARYGEWIHLSSETSVKKWKNVSSKPSFDKAQDISSLVLLKIVYEFLVLIAGERVLQRRQQLNRIREIILSLDEHSACECVQRQHSNKYDSFHGICFYRNDPTATFQVRLFGKLAYIVTLPNLELDLDTLVYTYCLSSKEHVLKVPNRPH